MRGVLLLLAIGCIGEIAGFSPSATPRGLRALSYNTRAAEPAAVVVDISSTEEFNEALESAGDALVVVDYSTSWCGPCKIIAPKFDEFSEQYTNVAFLKVAHPHCLWEHSDAQFVHLNPRPSTCATDSRHPLPPTITSR